MGLRLIDVERLERGEADIGPYLEAIARQLGKPTTWFVDGAEAMPGEAERLGAETGRRQEVAPSTETRTERERDLERQIAEKQSALEEAEERLERHAQRLTAEAGARAERMAAHARREAEERAAALEQRIGALRKEHDEALAQLRADEHRVEELERWAMAAERRAAELAARIGRAEPEETRAPVHEVEQELAPVGAPAASGHHESRAEGLEAQGAGAEDAGDEPQRVATAQSGEAINLNTVTFEQLRALGMSITQSKRVIAYRERLGGYETVDDLDAVPGFPMAFRAELKSKLTV